MKFFTFSFKSLLVACGLLLGSANAWADTETVWKTVKSWDFETGFAATDIAGLLPEGYWTVSGTGTSSSAQVTTTMTSAAAVTTNSSNRYYGILLRADNGKMTLSQGGIALQGGNAWVTIPDLEVGQRVTIIVDHANGVISNGSTAVMESFTTTQIGSTSRYQTVGVVSTGGNLVVKRSGTTTFRIKSIKIERYASERTTSILDHTAGAGWGSNTGASTVDTADELYNQDKSSGWAGCAYAKFSYSLPAGHIIKSAILTYSVYQDGGSGRNDIIYYMKKDFDLDWATFAGQTATDLRNSGYRAGKAVAAAPTGGTGDRLNLSQDVTKAVQAMSDAGQNYIIFQWTGNAGKAHLYGKGADASKQPILVIETAPEVLAAIDDCEAHETSSAFATAIEAESFTNAAEVYAFHTAWQVENASSNDITKVIFDAAVSDFSRWNDARSNSGQQYTGAPDSKYFDAWNNDASDGKQKIYGLPAGAYSLKVATRASEGITDKSKYNVWVNGGSADASVLGNHVGSEGGDLGNGWSWTFLSFTLDAKADVEIGFYSCPPTDLWAGADDWHLYKVENVTTTISEAGYATFNSDFALDLDNISGATAYIVKADAASGDNIVITPQTGKVAANTGLILKGAAGPVTIPVAASGDAVSENKLVAVTEDATAVDAGNYVLGAKANNSNVGLYRLSSAANLNKGQAYLPGGFSSVKVLNFIIEGETPSGVETVQGEGFMVNDEYYNLNGQRVTADYKGIVIKNGKKYLNK